MKKIGLLFLLSMAVLGCKSDDDGPAVENASVTFHFTQNFDGTQVTAANFGTSVYTNAFGNFMTINKLRYLISRITLQKEDGTEIALTDYTLIDLEEPSSLNLTPAIQVPAGNYTGISFVYGFNAEDNISGAYSDLNNANWGWPSVLGGGYHFMQLEGTYDDTVGAQQEYKYNNGTARVSENVFEQNFIEFDLDQNFTISNDTTIEIKMNIAEWFKNPYTWDLNLYHSDLISNYLAQKFMQQNGADVFTVGTVD